MTKLVPGPVRELTNDERFKWGECPICKAPHGENCYAGVGIPLGMSAGGGWPNDGVHLARLRNAPDRVRKETTDTPAAPPRNSEAILTELCDRLDRIHCITLDRSLHPSMRLMKIREESNGFARGPGEKA